MTDKEKESEQSENVLAIIAFLIPAIAFLIWMAYEAYNFHPLFGWWIIILEIATVNYLVKKASAVKEQQNNQP